jgi:tRNA dimethylallyltransferase
VQFTKYPEGGVSPASTKTAGKLPLVVIVGPTATGKSEIAIQLAEEFNGEIVSADSRQVYRGMDIGTGKVLAEQQGRIPHHLLDVADPKQTYTLAQFQKAAIAAIEDIQKRGRLPFLVGGTGLYVRAVVDNLRIPAVPPQAKLRQELEKLSLAKLQQRLKEVEPIDFDTIDLKNPRRVIRAIEVSETAGVPFSKLRGSGPTLFDALEIGIRKPDATLRERIETRMKERMDRGLVDEVKHLHQQGVTWAQFEAFGLEYRRVAEYMQGKLTYEQALAKQRQDLFKFAKRQMTWFKKDRRIKWVDDDDGAEELVSDWLVKRAAAKVKPGGR